MRAGALLQVVGAIGVAGAGLFLWFRGGEDRLAPPPPRLPSQPAVASRPDTTGKEAPPPSPNSESQPPDSPPPPKPSPHGRLQGKVLLPPGMEGAPKVTVLAIGSESGEEPVAASAALDGTVDHDISPFLASSLGVKELEVSAEHPACLPARTRTGVPPPERRGEGPVVVAFEIRLVPAAVLRGRVADGAGAPLPGATAAAFVLLENGPSPPAVDQSETGDDGGFRIRLRHGDRYLLVAAADGRVPTFLEVAGGDASAPDLALLEGVSISGRVTDGEGKPRKGAALQARPTAAVAGTDLYVGRRELLWANGRLSPSETRAVSGEDGRYALGGLDPGEYEVSIEALEGERDLPDAFGDLKRILQAPAADQDFRVTFTRVHLSVLVDGKPAAGQGFLLMGGKKPMFGAHLRLDDRGRVTFLARSGGGSYKAKMGEKEVFLGNRSLEIPADAGDHEATLAFERPKPKGVLFVTLEPPAGSPPVQRAGFGFYPSGAEEDLMPGITRSLEVENGRFRILDLDPGPYRMVVRAGGGWYGGEGTFLDEAVAVTVPAAGGETVVRVPLRPGGRLRIAARNREGQYLGADCAIQDGIGQDVDVLFFSRSPGKGFIAQTGALLADSESGVDPALPPGRYSVAFTLDGYLDRTERVEVKAGESVLLETVLDRR